MTNRTITLGLLLLSVLLAACKSLREPLTFDPDVARGTFANGISYYVRHNKKPAGRVELRLAVRAGSVLEADDQQGLAHFLEHMAFNGTEHYAKQELVDYLEGIGMRFGPDLNAYTSFDETVYKLQIPTDNPGALDSAFTILRDWAFGICNEAEEIDNERGVVIEEWRLRRSARQRIRDRHYPILFHNSRYAERLPIGKKDVIATFSHDRLRDLYEMWYRPELMTVIAVGDADPDDLLKRIRENFGHAVAKTPPVTRPYDPVPDHKETLVSIVSDVEATYSSVAIYYKHDVPSVRTVGDFRQRLIESLFTRMLNQRFDEIRQRADAPFLSASSYKGRYVLASEVFSMRARVPDNGCLRGLGAILAEADRVRRHGFTIGELARMKAEFMSKIERAYNERETTESAIYARRYVRNFTRNTISPSVAARLRLYRELLPGINLCEVNKLVKNLMTTANRVVLINGPEKDDVALPTEQEVHAAFDAVAAMELVPYVDDVGDRPLIEDEPTAGEIVESDRIDELDVTRWTLSNGARIVLKPTDFKKDEILFTAYSAGGHSLATDADFIPAASADGVVPACGWGSFSKSQLEKKLAGRQASADPYISELQEGVRGSCRPTDLEIMMQLIRLVFVAPRTDQDAYAAYLARTRSRLENRLAKPEAVFNDEIQVRMSRDHPRRRPWTPATVDAMDIERSHSLYRQRFDNAGDFTFVFVGSFTLERIGPFIQQYIAGLPGRNAPETWRDHGIRPPEGPVNRTVWKGLAPKSHVRIFYGGQMQWSYEERYRIRSMATVLRIRLREEMREALGGTYGVGVRASLSHYPVPRYEINFSFGCAPDQVDSLIAVVQREVERLQNEPIEETYLTKVKQSQLREREIGLERNSFWLYILEFYDWHGEDPRTVLDFESYVANLTQGDIRETARRCFTTPNVATFILRPESESAN